MCGIAGIVGSYAIDESNVRSMITALEHRGPDDSGYWLERELAVALGHRRLAIVDLTQEGHQPMHSISKRYVIVFNGEIYNFLDLKRELEGLSYKFRGSSDTEVMLAAFEEWGVQAALKRFNGMFALAIWDRAERKLIIARDRIGKKPLYYGWVKNQFVFASELKAISAVLGADLQLENRAISDFFRFNYIPGPLSIYKGIYKLEPGCLLELGLSSLREIPISFSARANDNSARLRPCAYWSLYEEAIRAKDNMFEREADVIFELEKVLSDAVRIRMLADVPVGAFLSGGIDSSTIVALMQANSTIPVKTFSIGFSDDGFNEARYAKKIAEHLHTDHSELYLSAAEACDVLYQLPKMYDEPFADSSQIPTFLVSQLARQKVTVSLSGDAGDELFAGYDRYQLAQYFSRVVFCLPKALRHFIARLLQTPSTQSWDTIFKILGPLVPRRLRGRADRLYKLSQVLTQNSIYDVYFKMCTHWEPKEILSAAEPESESILKRPDWRPNKLNLLEDLMFIDILSYLVDDILVKVDRASMAVSLEARAPLLDYRVVELACRIPTAFKVKAGETKWPLRQILYKYVPKQLLERPKMGFGIPLAQWLRGPMREYAEDMLSVKALSKTGLLNESLITQKWRDHINGVGDWHYLLWDVIIFQGWFRERQSKLNDAAHAPKEINMHSGPALPLA